MRSRGISETIKGRAEARGFFRATVVLPLWRGERGFMSRTKHDLIILNFSYNLPAILGHNVGAGTYKRKFVGEHRGQTGVRIERIRVVCDDVRFLVASAFSRAFKSRRSHT